MPSTVALMASAGIAGALGYALTILARGRLAAPDFVVFAGFWSALFVVISALAGMQQEVARATAPGRGGPGVALRAGWIAAAGVGVALAASTPVWVAVAWGRDGWWLAPALAVGAGLYLLVAVMQGLMYGVGAVRSVAAMVLADAALRCAVGGALVVGGAGPTVIAWGLIVPFVLVPAAFAAHTMRATSGKVTLDVATGRLLRNAAKAVVASAAMGVVVSGLPFLVAATPGAAHAEAVSAHQYAIQLVRAPVIVAVLSLQSLLIVRLREAASPLRDLATVLGVIVTGTVVLVVLAALVGPALSTPLGLEPSLGAYGFVNLVGSALPVCVQVVFASALMASSRHGGYVAGWVASAAMQVTLMVLPWPLDDRVTLALWVAPTVGLAVHAGWWALGVRRDRLTSAGVSHQRADA